MGEQPEPDLVRYEIQKRRDTLLLVTRRELVQLGAASLAADLLIAACAILASAYVGDSNPERSSGVLVGSIMCGVLAASLYLLKALGLRAALAAPTATGSTVPVPTGGGLRIISAIYGTSEHSTDVTDQLAQRIHEGKLKAFASNKLGGDPHPDVVKSLEVTFEVGGHEFVQVYNENTLVDLP